MFPFYCFRGGPLVVEAPGQLPSLPSGPVFYTSSTSGSGQVAEWIRIRCILARKCVVVSAYWLLSAFKTYKPLTPQTHTYRVGQKRGHGLMTCHDSVKS